MMAGRYTEEARTKFRGFITMENWDCIRMESANESAMKLNERLTCLMLDWPVSAFLGKNSR